MFRIRLIWVGKTREPFVNEGIRLYEKKLKPYVRLVCEEIHSAKHRIGDIKSSRAEETQRVLQRLDDTEPSIFLDEKGKSLSSVNFAKLLDNWMPQQISRLTFVIGGAYGFDHTLLPMNVSKLQLSEMTLNHQLARVMFLEQLYRALTIIRGEPYHH